MYRQSDTRRAAHPSRRWKRFVRLGGSLLVLGAVLTGTSNAVAATPLPPSVVAGLVWCGHFDHARPGAIPRRFRCPPPPRSLVSLVTDAPNGPFSSGQYINVIVGPNPILDRGRRIYIKECAAPGGVVPKSPRGCDRLTLQANKVYVGDHGRVSFVGYPIFALPDATVLGERPTHTPICDLSHACVLYLGQDRHDFDQPHVWSSTFYVNPTQGDTGADPGNGLPEVPYVLALPVLAGIAFATAVLLRRRNGKTPPV